MEVGIGLVGCGVMARVLTAHLVRDPRVVVRGVFDPDAAAAEETRRTVAPQAHVHASLDGLLADPAIEWVHVASWNRFHAEQVLAAFEAGKDVFCQKPLATTLEDALAMKRAWHASGRRFAIGFTLRYASHYRRIHELVAGGALGELVSFEQNETLDWNHGGFIMGDWRRKTENAGTHLLEKCCHDVDVANWITGSRPARVASFGGLSFFTPENAHHAERIGPSGSGRPAYRAWRGEEGLDPFRAEKDIVDHQVAILEYENGVRATFHANCNAGLPERRLYLCGTEGALRADVLRGRIEWRRIGWSVEPEVESSEGGMHGGGDPVLARELTAAMLGAEDPAVGLEEALEASLPCFAIDRAREEGRVVELAPLWERARAC